MTISINHNYISLDSLSKLARVLIDQIPFGGMWLVNALTNSSNHLSYCSELKLIESMLSGLHNEEYLYLESTCAFVHPAFLFQFSYEDVQSLLSNSEPSIKDNPLGIHGRKTILKVRAFLEYCELEQASVDQHTCLEDMFYVAGLIDCEINTDQPLQQSNKTTPIHKKAVEFASSYKRGITAFFHDYLFYLRVEPYLSKQALSNPQESRNVQSIYTEIMSDCDAFLYSPMLSFPVDSQSLSLAIQESIRRGDYIGFVDAASAIYYLSHCLDMTADNESSMDLRLLFYTYFMRFQALIYAERAKAFNLSQTGKYWRYTYENNELQAILQLDLQGRLTLLSCHIKRSGYDINQI